MGGIHSLGLKELMWNLPEPLFMKPRTKTKTQEETPKRQHGSSRKIHLLEATLAGRSRYLLEFSILETI